MCLYLPGFIVIGMNYYYCFKTIGYTHVYCYGLFFMFEHMIRCIFSHESMTAGMLYPAG